MALTRDFKNTVVARVERDPAFAKALLDEAATLVAWRVSTRSLSQACPSTTASTTLQTVDA
jgi:hypothetical protein